MNLDFSPDDEAFRAEVRAFITQSYPPELRQAQDEGRELGKQDYLLWHKVLAKKGWVAPAWPVEFGGTGWTPTQRYIWADELAKADAAPLAPKSRSSDFCPGSTMAMSGGARAIPSRAQDPTLPICGPVPNG